MKRTEAVEKVARALAKYDNQPAKNWRDFEGPASVAVAAMKVRKAPKP